MTFRFYASDDGEVLSNKDYPVDKPMLVIPCIDPVPISHFNECDPPEWAMIRYRTYRAYTITDPTRGTSPMPEAASE